jgi:iron complex outermembrane recepter protein
LFVGNAGELYLLFIKSIMKKIKNYSFIIGCLLTSISAFSQNILSGKVTDGKDSSALAEVVIYIPDLKVAAITNAEGTYTLKNLPKGRFLVQVKLLGYASKTGSINIRDAVTMNVQLMPSNRDIEEVVVTGNSQATAAGQTPQTTTEISKEYLDQNSSTNIIDAIAKTPGVSAMTDGQSISKPVIRGLGYNRVLTLNDGVIQVDQAWFDEFGIEADPDAVERVEVLKGPASLAYGSDAIAGVVNLIPEKPLPEGQIKGEVMTNYQTNNGLINQMFHVAGTKNGISWSARADNIMAHSYQDPVDGYALNTQFNNFNADGTIGLYRKWGYTQLHASYFDMSTGIVDGTRDSATGIMERQVSYPGLYGGAATYVIPSHQEQTSYTPFVINQRIRHTKVVWDNSLAVGKGRITGIFSYQLNQRQETNDPTIVNNPDINYYSNGATYDVRYVSPQMGGFNYSAGANGIYQASQSLQTPGTLMLVPNYNLFQVGGFAIANEKIGNLSLSGGIRYDTRTFTGKDHWVDSNQVPVAANTVNAIHEFQGFTTKFSGMSGSFGAVYNFKYNVYVKGNIARGYRAPNVSECAANGIHDGTVVWELGDANLKPEFSLEEDLSIGMNGKDISFEVDAFNNSIQNFIYAVGLTSKLGGDSLNNTFPAVSIGPAPVYKYTQGAAQLYGGEAMLTIHPRVTPWVELYSTLSVVQGGVKNVADSLKVLPFVPPTRVTVDLKFKIRKTGKSLKNAYIKAGMLGCFQQNNIYEQYAIYNGYSQTGTPFEYAASKKATAGYMLFNAGFGGDILNSSGKTAVKLFFVCNNILNTAYMDYMSRFKYYPVNYATGRVGVFNMGRNFSIKLIIPLNFKS